MSLNRIAIALLGILLTFNGVFAQDIEWSETLKNGGRNSSIIYGSGGDFYVTQYKKPALNKGLEILKYSNLVNVASLPIDFTILGSKASVYNVMATQDKLIVIFGNQKSKKEQLFYQIYDKSFKPLDGQHELIQLDLENSKTESYFNYSQSKDRDYLCLEYCVKGQNGKKNIYGYKVYNSNFELVNQGQLDFPYERNEFEITNRFLSNEGEYFIGYKVFKKNDKGQISDQNYIEDFKLITCKENQIHPHDLNKETEQNINELFITPNERGETSFLATYGPTVVTSYGFCVFQFEDDVIKKVISPFKNNLENDTISNEKEPFNRQKFNIEMAHYDSKGELVIVYEKQYVVTSTYTDSKGNVNTNYNYHHTDIYFSKLNQEGDVIWESVLGKNQRSVNDGGLTNSIAGYFKDDSFVFFLNDNEENYDVNGDFNVSRINEIKIYLTLKKNSGVAKVEMDLSNGNYSRKLMVQDEENRFYIIPSCFATDYENNFMIMYLRLFRKEKFGLLHF